MVRAMTRPSEDDLISRWLKPLATDPGALGLGDDCARLSPPEGSDLILKADAIAAGIHFFADDPWDAVARKALRVNLSDLAAKGARPIGYLLSLALPRDWTEENMEALASGLAADQQEFDLPLFGGDTIKSPDGLILSVTMMGAVPKGRGPSRQQARAGDRIYMSGTLGDAALGLHARLDPDFAGRAGFDSAHLAHVLDRYLLPRPRLGLAPAVLAHAKGAMDISDGLAIDLARLGRASGTHAVIDLARIPLSAAATRAVDSDSQLQEIIITGGDDYEILVTVDAAETARFEATAASCGVAVTAIGHVESGSGAPIFLGPSGNLLKFADGGFRHF
jgi:thiamine-monophosphate kinase